MRRKTVLQLEVHGVCGDGRRHRRIKRHESAGGLLRHRAQRNVVSETVVPVAHALGTVAVASESLEVVGHRPFDRLKTLRPLAAAVEDCEGGADASGVAHGRPVRPCEEPPERIATATLGERRSTARRKVQVQDAFAAFQLRPRHQFRREDVREPIGRVRDDPRPVRAEETDHRLALDERKILGVGGGDRPHLLVEDRLEVAANFRHEASLPFKRLRHHEEVEAVRLAEVRRLVAHPVARAGEVAVEVVGQFVDLRTDQLFRRCDDRGCGGVFRKRRPRRAVARTRRRRAGPFRQARRDLIHARDVRKRIPAQLRRRQQIAARAVRLGRVGAEVLHRTFPDRLHPPELAVLTDAATHRRPRSFDAGEVRRLVKYAVVHAPGERVAEKRSRAHLRRVGILPVEEAGGPRPVRALDRPHLRAHLLEQRGEPPSLRAVRGKLADDERKSGEDPSVPASPEELLAIGSRPPHIPRVAPEEMILAVIEVVVGGTILAHHEIEVLPLARDRREFRPHGRRHEERVAPVPAPPVQDEALAFAAGKRRIDVRRHERVEFRAHGRHDRIVALRARDVEPGLSDAVRVAHVGVAFLERPAVRAPLVADGVDVPALSRRTRELRQPGVERAIAPVAVVGALRMRQHPVRHLHAVGRNRRGVKRSAHGSFLHFSALDDCGGKKRRSQGKRFSSHHINLLVCVRFGLHIISKERTNPLQICLSSNHNTSERTQYITFITVTQ